MEDDRQVGQVCSPVEGDNGLPLDAVDALKDQTGGQVAVAYHDFPGIAVRADLAGQVMMTVARDQAGERHATVDAGPGADILAERGRGRLAGEMDLQAAGCEFPGGRGGQGGLADAPGSVNAHE